MENSPSSGAIVHIVNAALLKETLICGIRVL
jgi:hypothetical protein